MMKFKLVFFLLVTTCFVAKAQTFQVKSPSEKLEVKITVDDKLSYQMFLKGTEIISKSEIDLTLDNGISFGENAKVKKQQIVSVSEEIHPVVPRKFSTIKNEYRELELDFKGNYSLLVRAYDEGVAYRWVSNIKSPCQVQNELASFNFTGDHSIWFPEEKSVYSHQEREYLNWYRRLSRPC